MQEQRTSSKDDIVVRAGRSHLLNGDLMNVKEEEAILVVASLKRLYSMGPQR